MNGPYSRFERLLSVSGNRSRLAKPIRGTSSRVKDLKVYPEKFILLVFDSRAKNIIRKV